MTKPTQFILSSDYATLKNDDSKSTSVTAPGSQSIAGSGYLEYHSDLTVGAQASLNRVQISSSKDSNTRYATELLEYARTGSLGGYNIVAYAFRISTTMMRCSIYVPNPYGGAMTSEAGDETFNFYINTFTPPYSS